RIDTGVRQDDTVAPFYDPMIAKIVASGEDRQTARLRLERALDETAVFGVATNLAFLRRVVAHAEFVGGKIDTGFIDRLRDDLLPAPEAVSDTALAAASVYRLLKARRAASSDPSPWQRPDGWRLNSVAAPFDVTFRHGSENMTVEAVSDG